MVPGQRRRKARVGTAAAAKRYRRVNRNLETQAVTRDKIEALVAPERPGWRVVEVTDESGPSLDVTAEGGDQRRTVLVGAARQIVGERH